MGYGETEGYGVVFFVVFIYFWSREGWVLCRFYLVLGIVVSFLGVFVVIWGEEGRWFVICSVCIG